MSSARGLDLDPDALPTARDLLFGQEISTPPGQQRQIIAREEWDAEGHVDNPISGILMPPWPAPGPNDIPLVTPQQSQVSREQQELAEARARSALSGHFPTVTSYGPAPVPEEDDISIRPMPLPFSPVSPSRNSQGPFMHYEDVAYFDPESEPKDETDVGPRSGSFPAIPKGMNRPKARRSWDRQRKRRMKNGTPNGDDSFVATEKVWWSLPGEYGECCVSWAPELLWSLLSVICFAAIVVIFKRHDGQGLPGWPLGISLNTLIAFLEAICRVALIAPLTEGLAQLKWNWFARGERTLADFNVFDDAVRGPVGNAKLIYKRKGRTLGMSAAVVLLTSFASSPLTQAAITYPTRLGVGGNGTATIARGDLYAHPEYTVLTEEVDIREKQAIQQGLYQPVDQELLGSQPFCTSSECQWQVFSSLAVCAAVADISDKLTISDSINASDVSAGLDPASSGLAVHNASLPNGILLFGGTDTFNMNMSSAVDGATGANFLPVATSISFSKEDARVSSAIANFFIVYTNQTSDLNRQDAAFRAVEVLFHFCVNTYSVSVSQGTAETILVNSSTILGPSEPTSVVLQAFDERYTIKRDDVRLLSSHLTSLFSGVYSYRYGKEVVGMTAASDAMGTAMFGRKDGSGTSLGDSEEDVRAAIGNLTRNVATSLTNCIRSAAAPTAFATGVTLSTESYVHIRWSWLAFLATQVVMSIALMVGIIVQTAAWNVMIVKGSGSAMATLLALSPEDRARLGQDGVGVDILDRSTPDVEGATITQKIHGVKARLKSGDRGWRMELGFGEGDEVVVRVMG